MSQRWTPERRAAHAEFMRAWWAARAAKGLPPPAGVGSPENPDINRRIDLREYGARSAATRWTPERREEHSRLMREWWTPERRAKRAASTRER